MLKSGSTSSKRHKKHLSILKGDARGGQGVSREWKNLKSQRAKASFKHLDKLEVSASADVSKIIKKKQRAKNVASKFYERSEKLKQQKMKLTQKVIKRKGESLEEFNKDISSRIKRIKRRTLNKVTLDKYMVRDCIRGLRAFVESSMVVEEEEEDEKDQKKGKNKKGAKDGKKAGGRSKRNHDLIFLEVLTSQKMQRITLKPIKIPLVHPIHRKEFGSNIALFTKDNEKKLKDTDSQWLRNNRITVFNYSKLIELSQSKKLTSVLKGFDVFLCCQKIFNSVTKNLRKELAKKSLMPYPVELGSVLGQESREEALMQILGSVYFLRRKGPVYRLAVARIDMSDKECVKNVINLVYEFIPQILVESPKNTTIMKINLKTSGSKSLPIYENDFVFVEEKEDDGA